MTLLTLPRVQGMTKNGYQRTIFKSQNVTPIVECELNHASLSPIVGVTNLKPREPYWKENF